MPTARDLLARVMDWPGPQGPGYVNVHWWSPHKDHPLPDDPHHKVWWGKPAKTLDEALSWATWAMRQQNIRDIYFCTSVQAATDRSKAGKPKPLRNKANALNLKCLFIDVDYGKPDKDGKKTSYATLHEALGELAAFCVTKQVPNPTALVATGGGVHAYWILDKAIPPSAWQPYADGLKSAALEYGLLCDAGVTVDCARILRVPDTLNWKSDPVRPVSVLGIREADYALDDLKHLLDFAPVTATVTPTQMTWGDGTPMVLRPHLPGEIESLAEGLGYEEKLLDPLPILRQCAFFGDALATGGATYANPLWNLSTLGATFLEKGHELAHRMSDGHRDYNHATTEALYERKVRERQTSNLGWPTCATIETNGCTRCATCPFKGKIKSPLSLGRALPGTASAGSAPAPGPVTSATGFNLSPFPLPYGYVLSGDYIHAKTKIMDENGQEVDATVQVFSKKITGAFCTREPDAICFTTSVDKGQYHRAAVKREELSSRDSVSRALFREKAMPTIEGEKYARGFLMSLMSQLEDAERSQQNHPFGWHYDDSGEVAGFVYGGKIFHKTGVVTDASHAASVKSVYQPHGTINAWYDACKLVTEQHAPALECSVAVAFASPLMIFPAEYSTLVWVWGVGGRGKSTALEVGMAVWGHPAKTKEQTASTLNSIMEKMGKLQNLPIYVDEISDDDSMKMVYKTFWQGTVGSTKGRLTSAITERDKDSWHNQISTTSNNSIVDYIEKNHPTTDAAVRRVLELYVTEPEDDRWHVAAGSPGRIRGRDATAIKDKLSHHYGNMGLLYAEHLGVHHDAVRQIWSDIADSVDIELDRLATRVKQAQVERYWRAAITTLLTGATVANQLGCDFHITEMREYLVEQYKENVTRLKEITVNLGSKDNTQQQLTQYLKFQRQNTIWTDTYPASKASPKPKVLRGLSLDRERGTEIQWCVDDRRLRIGQSAFKTWLGDVRHVATFPVIKSLKESFGATVAKQTLGAGTKYAEGQEWIIDVPVPPGSELEQMMYQGAVPAAPTPPPPPEPDNENRVNAA